MNGWTNRWINACMHTCMYECMYVFMYLCIMYVRKSICNICIRNPTYVYAGMCECVYVCVCMYVCMHACMCVCVMLRMSRRRLYSHALKRHICLRAWIKSEKDSNESPTFIRKVWFSRSATTVLMVNSPFS